MNTTITETFEVSGFDTVNKMDRGKKLGWCSGSKIIRVSCMHLYS